jgi:hypothetical protein
MENMHVNSHASQFTGTEWKLKISFILVWLYLWGRKYVGSILLLAGEEKYSCILMEINFGRPNNSWPL